MNAFLIGVARAVAETFELPEPILEIGSYQVEKQGGLANLRGLFPDSLYQGLDMRAGPGVDLVANVEELPHLDRSVGTVLALSTFEHVRHFWRGFAEIRRVLRPHGALLVSMPFYFQIHNHPSDYWRFTPHRFGGAIGRVSEQGHRLAWTRQPAGQRLGVGLRRGAATRSATRSSRSFR